MKRVIPFILAILVTTTGFSQNLYEVFTERPNEKTFKGIISRDLLKNDTSFHWYAQNQKGYKPNVDALEGLIKQKDSIHLLVFMGTWCEDSHVIIPKLFSLVDTAGFPLEKLTLIGVDRKKTVHNNLHAALNVKNVPTIMVMKNGKEVGRVVEYGKFGLYDMELGAILKGMY